MKTLAKIVIVLTGAAAAVAAVALKKNQAPAPSDATAPPASAATTSQAVGTSAAGAKLPKLVDLGADKCIPCKMMAPVLEQLSKEYAGRLQVDFIDVWKNPEAGKPYGIQMIPTQIFFDASGKELFRHVGFFGKDDILAQWKKLGVDLAAQ